MKEPSNRFLASNRSHQVSVEPARPVMVVSSGIIAATLGLGTAGYLFDASIGTRPWLLLLGLCAGLGVGLCAVMLTSHDGK